MTTAEMDDPHIQEPRGAHGNDASIHTLGVKRESEQAVDDMSPSQQGHVLKRGKLDPTVETAPVSAQVELAHLEMKRAYIQELEKP